MCVHILCIFVYHVYNTHIMYIQRKKSFQFCREVGMGDMRGAGGRRHGRGQREEWDGENVVTFLLK